MKTKLSLCSAGILALGLLTIAPTPADARPQQAAPLQPAPPPTYAQLPAPPPDGPPPPPRPGRPPAPPPPCGPDMAPPPRAAGDAQVPLTTLRGSIRQFNYGPEGEVAGLLLSNGTLVNFPPEMGVQIAGLAKVKSEVSVAGYQRQGTTGKTVFSAVTVTVDGQTFGIPGGQAQPPTAPPPPPPNDSDPAPPRN
jgi:hypothetical protein